MSFNQNNVYAMDTHIAEIYDQQQNFFEKTPRQHG
jgi:hypothetical protein